MEKNVLIIFGESVFPFSFTCIVLSGITAEFNMTEKLKTDENNKIDHVIKLITSLQEQNKTIVTQNNIINNELKEF